MRNIIALAALAAAVLPAVASQAQTVDICDRTQHVLDAILDAVDADDCAAVDSDSLAGVGTLDLRAKRLTALRAGDFNGLTGLTTLRLHENQLTALPDGAFDGLGNLQLLWLQRNQLTTLSEGAFEGLTSLRDLSLSDNRLTILPAGVFDGLTSLQRLWLFGNQLTALPDGVFDGLTVLHLHRNRLTALPEGAFDGLTSLESLTLSINQLTALPEGAFDGLTSLRNLSLSDNRLTTLPDSVFDGLTRLEGLGLSGNQLTTLLDGVFNGLTSLESLFLSSNQLTALPDGVFDGLTRLQLLELSNNRLTTLPAGVFDGLTSLQSLWLDGNRLTTLPAGVFDGLANLELLDLRENHLVGLTRDDPLFAGLSSEVDVQLSGQTEPPEPPPPTRLAAAVPLMLSSSDSTRQGFVRVVNESGESGAFRVFAFDDGGHAPDPIEIRLGAGRVAHFNSDDLEYGNAAKGLETGVGGPVQGDWRLDVETDLAVRVLAFVRHGGGFLTAMHDVLPRDAAGRLVAHTFNPGSNTNQASSLRFVNTGANDERVSIEGVDDQGDSAGPVTLTLPAGESRTLSAFDLENGAQGFAGTLGAGEGKWRLLIAAGRSVVGMSLLESTGGQLTNISTAGVASDGQ